MSFANVNLGTTAGDGSGDPLRTAFNKINQNFANIAAGQITVNAPVLTVAGRTGNIVLTASDVAGTMTIANLQAQLTSFTGNLAVVKLQTSGDAVTGYNSLYVGRQTGFTVVPNLLTQHTGNFNSYSQINSQNTASGNQSTTDYVATADNGSNTSNYIDMGIAGGSYDGTVPSNSLGTSLYPNDGYVYVQGSTPGTAGGNLVLGTTVPGTSINFLAGGINSSNIAVSINNPGTNPTSVSTGALVVVGGVGVSGNLNVGQYNKSLHNIRGNILLGIGNVVASADSILTINQNSATPLNAPNNIVHMSAPDGKSGQYGADSFGDSTVYSGMLLRKARGTSSSPAPLLADDIIASFAAKGWSGVNGFTGPTYLGSNFSVFAAENYTNTNQGTYIRIATIPIGANTTTLSAKFSNNSIEFHSNTTTVFGNLQVTGNTAFTMANVAQWTVPVYNVQDALNQLAGRLANIGH